MIEKNNAFAEALSEYSDLERKVCQSQEETCTGVIIRKQTMS